jgi:hypothetical protein
MRLPSDWKIWACSPGNTDLQRIDTWFELHGDLDHAIEGGKWEPYLAWINLHGFEVYAQDQHLIPRAKTFPVEELLREFGENFFSSQPAWMMAFAIYKGATDIALFGLDMAARTEYHFEKPNMLHFAWLAQQRGIRVMAPPESEVLAPPPLYGYSLNSPMARKLRIRYLELEEEVQKMDAQIAVLQAKRQHFQGCLDDCDWAMQTWTGGLYREQNEVVKPLLRPVEDAAE